MRLPGSPALVTTMARTATAGAAATRRAATGPAGVVAALLALGGLLTLTSAQVADPVARTSQAHPTSHAHRWASSPTPTAAQAGYVASGRVFRYAQAVITLPAERCVISHAMPRLYVALAGPGTYARAGLACVRRQWEAFAQASGPAGALEAFGLRGVRAGSGVFVSVHLGRGGSVRCSFVLPGGAGFGRGMRVGATEFTQAEALADWSGAGRGVPGPAAGKQRLTQFLSGAFTTANGRRGVFTGPWNAEGRIYGHAWRVRPLEAVAHGSALARPSYLWTDGTQAAFGSWGDAFGVWLYR